MAERDEMVRRVYFDCDRHQCHREWSLPAGPGDQHACKEIGYIPHRLDRCPAKGIWAGTRAMFVNRIFRAALRSKDSLICGRGVMDEPVSLGEMVDCARGELEAFRMIVSERRAQEKRRNP